MGALEWTCSCSIDQLSSYVPVELSTWALNTLSLCVLPLAVSSWLGTGILAQMGAQGHPAYPGGGGGATIGRGVIKQAVPTN